MKPLVTTVRAVKALATDISPAAIDTTSNLHLWEGQDFEVLVHREDGQDEQLVAFMRDDYGKDPFVPEKLRSFRAASLSRIASFAERVRGPGGVSLPQGWRQYKHQSLVSFFAVPGTQDSNKSRWIAELLQGDQHDVVVWGISGASGRELLEEFSRSARDLAGKFRSSWLEAHAESQHTFIEEERSNSVGSDFFLGPLEVSPTKGWPYEKWIGEISADQRAFIEAGTDRSIRLRGPAGSGKTLAIVLKAIREAEAAAQSENEIRLLVVTHSWALATEISDSLESVGQRLFPEVDVFPLLEIAKSISPQYVHDDSGFNLVGDDSQSGKTAQLDEILEAIDEFLAGDWITFKANASPELRDRLETHEADGRFALAWDLLIEFGSVIGASAIFPGAGAEARYLNLGRSSWMMPFQRRDDLRVVFAIYSIYMRSLEARSLLTADQVMADLLSHLETHAWNRARKSQGYDLIFVDEFHLFSPLERQVIHYLSRDVGSYPRVFMALDPRQSPSEAFIGSASDETLTGLTANESNFGEVSNYELTTVHRFTPQILDLIAHIHHSFPTLNLGDDWDVDFSEVDSSRVAGSIPRVVHSASRAGEEEEVLKAVQEVYSHNRIALAVVDAQEWRGYSDLAAQLSRSGKYHVSIISSRTETETLRYRRRGVVVAPVEYLAGLQFETVLVAGIPDLASLSTRSDRTRLLSLLYLAVSRAENDVRLFVNDHNGGVADVFQQAIASGILAKQDGGLV